MSHLCHRSMYTVCMPANDRNNPERQHSSDSDFSLIEFMREYPDDAACLDKLWRDKHAPPQHATSCRPRLSQCDRPYHEPPTRNFEHRRCRLTPGDTTSARRGRDRPQREPDTNDTTPPRVTHRRHTKTQTPPSSFLF